MHVKHVSGDITSVGPWFSLRSLGPRGDWKPNLQYTSANLTIVAGDERVYPLEYQRSGEDKTVPLTELRAAADLPEGGEVVLTAIWPDVLEDNASEVVLDVKVPNDEEVIAKNHPPFRLTEVTIK